MIIKFKKGDRVRALNDGYSHHKGEVGIVDEDDSDCPYVNWDSGRSDATSQESLALEDNFNSLNYEIY